MRNIYKLLIFLLFFTGCSIYRNGEKAIKGDNNDAVIIAINDFVDQCKESKKSNLFSIYLIDIDEEIVGIIFAKSDYPYLPTSATKIGTNDDKSFPTRYIRKEGKIFFWHDPQSFITQEIVDLLNEHNLIDSINVNGFVGIPESIIDETEKGIHYYFCKKNLLNYKRIIAKNAMGWYDPPKLKCID